jgi:hypothetical protein
VLIPAAIAAPADIYYPIPVQAILRKLTKRLATESVWIQMSTDQIQEGGKIMALVQAATLFTVSAKINQHIY